MYVCIYIHIFRCMYIYIYIYIYIYMCLDTHTHTYIYIYIYRYMYIEREACFYIQLLWSIPASPFPFERHRALPSSFGLEYTWLFELYASS